MFSPVSREDPRRRWSCSPAGSPKKNAALGGKYRKESTGSDDAESYFCTYAWYESWLNRLYREFIKTSTFKIIVAAIFLHSAISIVLIYAHLLYYSDTYLSKHTSTHSHPNKGKLAVTSKSPLTAEDLDSELRYKISKIDYTDETLFGPRQSINLLHSKLLDAKELSYIGWFSDHYRWEEKVQCFNNRWTLCDTIYTARCKADAIRAIYQFVPFKASANIHQLFFSLRASAEQLVEQSTDPFYGLMGLVEYSDGSTDLVKLKFQYESDAWSLRTLNFEVSKRKTPIRSVTLMIACYGYTGAASFTDIRLSTRHAGVDPLFSSHEIASWCDYPSFISPTPPTTPSTNLYAEVLPLPKPLSAQTPKRSSKNRPPPLITFVSQVSMDRLTVLERSLLTWTGPVSLAIYIPVKEPSEGIQDWQRLYVNKKISSLSISLPESSILLVPCLESDNYPINRLRNLALANVRTRYLFLVDADFQPSPGLEANFAAYLRHHHHSKFDKKSPKRAFVVPAFEYLEMPNKNDPILKSKDELLQLIHREDPLISPFRVYESPESHSLTNYWRWYYTREPFTLLAAYHDKYEPYIIVEKTDGLPTYNEALTNYGMNKVMHITELFAANYTFTVLDNVWAIHFPHRSTPYYTDFLQNLEHRLRNRAQRFHVLAEILQKYSVQLRECPTR